MSSNSPIEWTDATWNPIRGCSRVSAGCENCYAEKVAARFSGEGLAYEGLARRRSNGKSQWTGIVRVIDAHMMDPLSWRKPRRVFVNSMSDLFHESLPMNAIAKIFAIMAVARWHTFQVLTKRADRMRLMLNDPDFAVAMAKMVREVQGSPDLSSLQWPLPNVWLGVSTENQETADERIPHLVDTPAVVRFLSCEPLLGLVDLRAFLWTPMSIDEIPGWALNDGCTEGIKRRRPGLDWVIVGGESGSGSRWCRIDNVRSLVEQCRDAKVACFVKQLGARPMLANDAKGYSWPGDSVPFSEKYSPSYQGEMARLFLDSKKGGDIEEWPEELRVREFPKVAA